MHTRATNPTQPWGCDEFRTQCRSDLKDQGNLYHARRAISFAGSCEEQQTKINKHARRAKEQRHKAHGE